MTLRDFIKGELIDIVEWLESSTDAMVWRFDRPNNELKNGARLIVRPGQVAVFVEQGTVADVFQPGQHELTTKNLPILSRLRGWKYGFASPFKAEVVFVSTRQFVSNKWGTKQPVMTRDPELGPVRLRVFGTYAVRVSDPEAFVRELVGANSSFTIGQITDQLRDLLVARFSELLGENTIPVLQLAANYKELGDLATARLAPELEKFGVELTKLVVESIALPDEVAATLDQRTRIGLIGGDMSKYAQLLTADAVRDAARNQGAGGAGAAVGVGLGMAQQLAGAANPTPRPAASPPPLPASAGFFIGVEGKVQGPLDAAALAQRVKDGVVRADTLVWRDGMATWAAAAQVPEVAELLRAR
ncbi:MAG TPA: SPFH domain-containing protein [Gemmatimonadaceae bacterium]|nr:SPFH domain-containing protein [Gemmatimonadaceae bacterium]